MCYCLSGTTSEIGKCPDVLRGVVSSTTGLSAVDINLDGTVKRIELPVGVYNYHTYGNTNCSLKIEIKGTDHYCLFTLNKCFNHFL